MVFLLATLVVLNTNFSGTVRVGNFKNSYLHARRRYKNAWTPKTVGSDRVRGLLLSIFPHDITTELFVSRLHCSSFFSSSTITLFEIFMNINLWIFVDCTNRAIATVCRDFVHYTYTPGVRNTRIIIIILEKKNEKNERKNNKPYHINRWRLLNENVRVLSKAFTSSATQTSYAFNNPTGERLNYYWFFFFHVISRIAGVYRRVFFFYVSFSAPGQNR